MTDLKNTLFQMLRD